MHSGADRAEIVRRRPDVQKTNEEILMRDGAEVLVDADARIQEHMEQVAQERARKLGRPATDPDRAWALESLRLARKELERQLAATRYERRRTQILHALEEVDRRMAEASAAVPV
jgi:hypothetical protein